MEQWWLGPSLVARLAPGPAAWLVPGVADQLSPSSLACGEGACVVSMECPSAGCRMKISTPTAAAAAVMKTMRVLRQEGPEPPQEARREGVAGAVAAGQHQVQRRGTIF